MRPRARSDCQSPCRMDTPLRRGNAGGTRRPRPQRARSSGAHRTGHVILRSEAANMSLQSAEKLIPDSTSFEFVALDTIKATPLRLGLEYWRAVRGARRFPTRDDIKARDICGALQQMSLIKVEGGDFI